jgi:hydrogenase expression/formation protein HypC
LKEIGICLKNPVSRSFRVVRGQNLWVAGIACIGNLHKSKRKLMYGRTGGVQSEINNQQSTIPMCLAVPAKIIAINGEEAVVEMDGVRLPAAVAFIRDPRIGDYVLLHAGFAIRKWSEQDVREYNTIVRGAD